MVFFIINSSSKLSVATATVLWKTKNDSFFSNNFYNSFCSISRPFLRQPVHRTRFFQFPVLAVTRHPQRGNMPRFLKNFLVLNCEGSEDKEVQHRNLRLTSHHHSLVKCTVTMGTLDMHQRWQELSVTQRGESSAGPNRKTNSPKTNFTLEAVNARNTTEEVFVFISKPKPKIVEIINLFVRLKLNHSSSLWCVDFNLV